MSYKLTAAAFFQAAALACLTAGCGFGPPPAGLVGADATPQAGPSASVNAPVARPDLCAEGVQSPLPPPTGHVNDYARVLDEETRRRLEEKLARLKAVANIEVGVVTVETTGGRDIFDYSLAVACGWGIGPRGGDGGGLLLLVATHDRRWRIQTSRSLEADLPDAEAAEIGGRMRSHLAAGAYGPGLEAGVDGLIARLAERRNFPSE